MVKQLLAAVLLPLFCGSALAQNDWAGGVAAEATKKWSLPRAWAVRIGPGLESRPLYAGGDDAVDAPPALRNLDLNASVDRRWLERWRFGSALRLRGRYLTSEPEREAEIRTWFYAESFADVRYTHWSQRFRTEQRFRGSFGGPLELSYRHRYRIGFERALAGQTVDPEEWFFTASVELLLSTAGFAARPSDIDYRPSVTVGKGRYEFGLEYRSGRELDGEDPNASRVLLGVLQLSL